ncbi:hypothetical protein RN001_000176 [Aquatica leii]|uniref:DDE Tnp4 domain-containing protein n=1 Tax=Aquatica leii TaxID=1421715 RepID=A0AAN7SSE3_9COLE|nr:hypothetical protein RN001_000176 [Aquatica leii]
MFSTSALIKIAVLLDEEGEEQMKRGQKRKRRFWLHDMLKKRNEEGEFVALHIKLMNDETKFFTYYRIQKRKRRFWVHDMLQNRNEEGEFATLQIELMEDETKFFTYYRMSKHEFNILLQEIEGVLQKENTTFRESIQKVQKLTVCLRFLVTGDSYQTIAFSFRLGHSTVHAIVNEVCNAIINKLLPVYIPTPHKEDWEKIDKKFWTAWNFPNCLGALDGKHIEIIAPANSGSYFNYKKAFSVVLLALVDADYKFLAVDVGSYGKNSDGGIFANSRLGRQLENGSLNIPDRRQLPDSDIKAPYVILVIWMLKLNCSPSNQHYATLFLRKWKFEEQRLELYNKLAVQQMSFVFRVIARHIT